jgi:hypothetical protein
MSPTDVAVEATNVLSQFSQLVASGDYISMPTCIYVFIA